MEQEKEKNPKILQAQMQRIMSGPEGKELLTLLSEGGGLKAAMEAFKKGDMKGVQRALSPVMESDRAKELVEKLNGK